MRRITIIAFITAFNLLLLTTDVQTNQLADNESNDLDNGRLLSGQLDGPINYHTLQSGLPLKRRKPMVQLPSNINGQDTIAPPLPQQRTASQWQEWTKESEVPIRMRKSKVVDQNSTKGSSQSFQSTEMSQLSQTQSTVAPLLIRSEPLETRQTEKCGWMTLREFKNRPINTAELIVRDANGLPSYIVSLRAFIRWKDDKFFPLSNFKVHLHAIDIMPKITMDGAMTPRFSATKCGGHAGTGPSDSSVPLALHRIDRSFWEEIIILVDCGYLVLNVQGDRLNLSLESLAFFQNGDMPPRSNNFNQPTHKHQARTSMTRSPEHMLISTEGTENAPLFVMPLSSSYICQNRIVLTGKDDIQFVMDHFELKRVSIPPIRRIIPETTYKPTFGHQWRSSEDDDWRHTMSNSRQESIDLGIQRTSDTTVRNINSLVDSGK